MWRKKIPWSSQIKQSQQDSIPPSTPLPPTQTQKKGESKQQDTTIKCKTANFKNVKLQCNTTVGKKIIIIIKKNFEILIHRFVAIPIMKTRSGKKN